MIRPVVTLCAAVLFGTALSYLSPVAARAQVVDDPGNCPLFDVALLNRLTAEAGIDPFTPGAFVVNACSDDPATPLLNMTVRSARTLGRVDVLVSDLSLLVTCVQFVEGEGLVACDSLPPTGDRIMGEERTRTVDDPTLSEAHICRVDVLRSDLWRALNRRRDCPRDLPL